MIQCNRPMPGIDDAALGYRKTNTLSYVTAR